MDVNELKSSWKYDFGFEISVSILYFETYLNFIAFNFQGYSLQNIIFDAINF
jgi:hypothetical protein